MQQNQEQKVVRQRGRLGILILCNSNSSALVKLNAVYIWVSVSIREEGNNGNTKRLPRGGLIAYLSSCTPSPHKISVPKQSRYESANEIISIHVSAGSEVLYTTAEALPHSYQH